MSEQPIEAGCLADVIWGLQGEKSPNIGLRVTVLEFRVEHSEHGRIWRCKAEYAERGQPGRDVPAGQVDFAQSWLKRVPKDPTPPASTKLEQHLHREMAHEGPTGPAA